MTLNFTPYSAFPAAICTADDDFGSMVWDRHCVSPWWLNWEKNDPLESGGGRDWTDPVDLLPADPFGMELGSNLAAAIVGWFEDLGVNPGDCTVYCWNGEHKKTAGGWFDDGWFDEGCFGVSGFGVGAFGGGVGDSALVDVIGAEKAPCSGSSSGGPEYDLPHEGLMLSLGYLGVQDLLSVERVCSSLRTAVQDDPLLWRCIHIDSPLSERITDDALLRLTLRSQGSLQCLNLVRCSRITDEGLKKVLESNPRLQKLNVTECRMVSMEGLIKNLKAFKSSGVTGIKHLKLGKSFSVSPEQYEELQMSLGGDEMMQSKPSKPRFYHCGASSVCDDDRAIDIEMCPCCQKFKLVFDCPSESCQGGNDSESCRACNACIPRCVQCGRCFTDCWYVETFFLDFICSGCWKPATELGR